MKICILYRVPDDTIKYTRWHDGFTKAISILQKTYNIDMINTFDNPIINFSQYTLVFFKESFKGNIYRKYKSQLVKNNILGLFISSSKIIPDNTSLNIYDILFYETKWYYNYASLNRHSNAYHAFGADNEIMKPNIQEKIYDVIFVGNITNYKRPLNILDIPGKKICLGFKSDKSLIKKLLENDVEIVEFVEYNKLADYYNKSKLCYIPCSIHGGGERAVLEARSCGIPVKIEDDNPKLKELCESDIYSSIYYSKQIEKAIYNFIYNNIKKNEYSNILKKLKNFKLNVLEVGGMDGKTFDPLYNNISNNWNVTILEPIKYQFDKLKKNYSNKLNVTLINKALNYSNKNVEMNTINPEFLKNNKVPSWANGISSFYKDRNSIGKQYWSNRGKVHLKNGISFDTLKDGIIEIDVECTTIEELNLDRIDILQSDTEGFDYNILKIVLEKYRPYVILFEWNNLPENELDSVKKLLIDYDTTFYNQDVLCILKP
jgi:FkbM family methyltransferase